MLNRVFAASAAVIVLAAPAVAADFKVGDKVQAWNIDWYDGTIAEVGAGSYAGYYLVKFDKYATPQYVKAANIRARPGASVAAAVPVASAPRAGKYTCMGYNGGAGQFRWYLQIDGKTYHQLTPNLRSGSYSYSSATRKLSFNTGPYAGNGWIGLFSVEREGRTHKIVLRRRADETRGPRFNEYANIYCTLSSDAAP